MAIRTIFISRNGNSTKIKLRDSEGHNPGNDDLTTQISPTDTINWVIDTQNPIASIDNIVAKPGNDSILKTAPNNSTGTWSATAVDVDPSPGRPKFYSYNVFYHLLNDTTTYDTDPKLNMN